MKPRFSGTPKDAEADFREANKDLTTVKDVDQRSNGRLRASGLHRQGNDLRRQFRPATGGFKAGFYSPVYGHFVDDEANYLNEVQGARRSRRFTSGVASAMGKIDSAESIQRTNQRGAEVE